MIEYRKEGRISIITINRPEALGALTLEMNRQLEEALVNFRDDEDTLVCIITGTGDRAFCTGMDINDMLPFIKSTCDKPWLQPASITRGLEIWKPIIAAINGLALGGGLELCLACDIRLAAEKARFGFPEARVGIFPGAGGTQRLPRLIPPGIAVEMLFTGRMIDAQEAYRIGLVNAVYPLDQLMQEARRMAETISEMAPLAIRAAKEAMVRGASLPLDEGLRLEVSLTPPVVNSRDFQEGLAAFAEKRKPKFEGR